MRIRRAAAPVIAGVLLLGGTACSEENPTSEVEDVSPELDEESGDAAEVTDDEGADPEELDEGVTEGAADEPTASPS